jgi:PleD family two-component response regulator
MIESQSQLPLVLIASAGEWVARSLENVLQSSGYTVLRVESGRRALELARRIRPDALLLDDALTDIGGVEVCRAIRDDPLFNHATPIFLMAAGQHASRIRAVAFEAGAWDYCTLPLDVDALVAKLGTFIRAAREIDDTRSKALIDRITGLYSSYGLDRWLDQLTARAVRNRESMACVVVAPATEGREGWPNTGDETAEALAELTDVCRSCSRLSDVVAYLGDSRVAIVTPGTDLAGVQQLIRRLQSELDRLASKTRPGTPTPSLRAGYYAVPNLAAANLVPRELVRRASAALSQTPTTGPSAAINFDEVLLS